MLTKLMNGVSLIAILRAPDGAGGGAAGGDNAGGGAGTKPGAGAGDGGGAGGAPGTGGDAASAAPDWIGGLPEDARGVVTTKGWKTPADAIKSFVELERTVGVDKIALPGKDAKPDAWDAVYTKLGRPEKVDGYRVPAPGEGKSYTPEDLAFQKGVLPILHKAGLSQRQLDAIAPEWNKLAAGITAAADQADADRVKAAKGALEAKWGDKYDAHHDLATRAVKFAAAKAGVKMEDVLAAKAPDGRFQLDDPVMAQLFAAVGEVLAGEHGALPDAAGGGDFGMTPAQAQAEIKRIEGAAAADPKHSYTDKAHPEHKTMLDKVERLYKIAHPAEPGAEL